MPGRMACFLGLASCGAVVYIPREPSPNPDARFGQTGSTAETGADTDTATDPQPWPCSPISSVSALLTVENAASASIAVYWADNYCGEWLNLTLEPSASGEIYTYVGHVFVARDLASGDALDWLQVGADPAQTWAVTP